MLPQKVVRLHGGTEEGAGGVVKEEGGGVEQDERTSTRTKATVYHVTTLPWGQLGNLMTESGVSERNQRNYPGLVNVRG